MSRRNSHGLTPRPRSTTAMRSSRRACRVRRGACHEAAARDGVVGLVIFAVRGRSMARVKEMMALAVGRARPRDPAKRCGRRHPRRCREQTEGGFRKRRAAELQHIPACFVCSPSRPPLAYRQLEDQSKKYSRYLLYLCLPYLTCRVMICDKCNEPGPMFLWLPICQVR